MINTIDDLIHHLEALKRASNNNLFVRTEIQVGKIIEIDTKVERFYNENKTSHIDILVIVGYVERE